MFPLTGTIDRRVLVAYRVAPDVARTLVPAPFRPDLSLGTALAGVCAMRVSGLRPAGLPRAAGLTFETVIHRIAVEWDAPDGVATGAYILRRDADSALAAAAGSRFVPGTQHRAAFGVLDDAGRVSLAAQSRDGAMSVALVGRPAATLPSTSVFTGADSATAFDRCGRVGYAPDRRRGGFGGVRLETPAWRGTPLAVEYAQSSLFEDRSRFPRGTAVFDHALIVRDLPGRWLPAGRVAAGRPGPLASAGLVNTARYC